MEDQNNSKFESVNDEELLLSNKLELIHQQRIEENNARLRERNNEIKEFIAKEMGELDDITETVSEDDEEKNPPVLQTISLFEHNEITNKLKLEIKRLSENENRLNHLNILNESNIKQLNAEIKEKVEIIQQNEHQLSNYQSQLSNLASNGAELKLINSDLKNQISNLNVTLDNLNAKYKNILNDSKYDDLKSSYEQRIYQLGQDHSNECKNLEEANIFLTAENSKLKNSLKISNDQLSLSLSAKDQVETQFNIFHSILDDILCQKVKDYATLDLSMFSQKFKNSFENLIAFIQSKNDLEKKCLNLVHELNSREISPFNQDLNSKIFNSTQVSNEELMKKLEIFQFREKELTKLLEGVNEDYSSCRKELKELNDKYFNLLCSNQHLSNKRASLENEMEKLKNSFVELSTKTPEKALIIDCQIQTEEDPSTNELLDLVIGKFILFNTNMYKYCLEKLNSNKEIDQLIIKSLKVILSNLKKLKISVFEKSDILPALNQVEKGNYLFTKQIAQLLNKPNTPNESDESIHKPCIDSLLELKNQLKCFIDGQDKRIREILINKF